MNFTDDQITALLHGRSISQQPPWDTDQEEVIDQHVRSIVERVCRKLQVLDRGEFNHYGSGYASYVDVWFYRDEEAFRFAEGNCYFGIVVLFSRLTPTFVLGEGRKTWRDNSASSYLPSFDMVDRFTHPAVQELEQPIERALQAAGLQRLRAEDLATPLPAHFDVPSILGDAPWRTFDALFHWMD